ncbi:bifunctional (p)ppGpp synthetase/guanosine-3',5'-bis(diphosphate) 3'-pyrophosphohydrolase [Patescibacteria group bacterium]|nr:bifunctional (p)ppGpp synthetase/guanosine-3',5'-bis(diphosphate) 3'-pyrophosphohydrolase [Patescibacteria group bacterium]
MPQKLTDALMQKIGYLPVESQAKIKSAVQFAIRVHEGQIRLSGVPQYDHALEVALYIAELRLDSEAIIASILHDTVEDTPTTIKDIKSRFGPTVARLVDGVTKLDSIRMSKTWLKPFSPQYKQVDRYENQVETLRKMFVAMSKDIRVVIIKLADRLCNLKTLTYLPEVKRLRIAQETMDIYAPIANRLGMGEFRCELEDLSFPHLMPKEYKWVKKLAIPAIEARRKYLSKVSKKLKSLIERQGVDAKIVYRAKRWYSLYIKLLSHDCDISKIYDVVALRVMVPSVEDCYNVLGIIHSLWKPLPGRIKDYIALPKPNGYRSIHTTVFADNGVITEVQVRTPKMDRQAEFGIAANWSYKEKGPLRKLKKTQLAWVNELLRWQSRIQKSKDIKEALALDFFSDRIFVFTPQGDAVDLPVGATPIDFAYAVHTAVGNQCVGAKVNGKMVSITSGLKNGDIIEIIKNRKGKPKLDWLRFVKTEHAKESIRRFIPR